MALTFERPIEAEKLTLTEEELDGYGVVHVNGELSLETATKLRTLVMGICEREPRLTVLDLEGVTEIDSAGLGVIVGSIARLSKYGCCRVAFQQEPLTATFEFVGLKGRIPIFASIEEALA